ncbi:hypothetical protein CBR_g26412 [Chara braunii]|uniref:ACT domain-containing protein n=1 Tax=Chara braunii TaxID=69332 RepID=A0A388L7Z4_CHABU|nr:hypothetical protein CBR_g26412 [Chara braunii]|eukprot:GBG78384.1 hypothetical protein CBR_g26412 [Chara braunii]
MATAVGLATDIARSAGVGGALSRAEGGEISSREVVSVSAWAQTKSTSRWCSFSRCVASPAAAAAAANGHLVKRSKPSSASLSSYRGLRRAGVTHSLSEPFSPHTLFRSHETAENRDGGNCPTGVQVRATLADVHVKSKVDATMPRGESWAVHKFGGTCVANAERIGNAAKIIVDDPSAQKAVVVSAMSKVTDTFYEILRLAESRDESYLRVMESLYQKHKETAFALLGPSDALEKFMKKLDGDISNLQAMMRAIFIAGHATDTFSDIVVGHGELWAAQLLAASICKEGVSAVWMDAREVLVVSPTSTQQVDPDYELSGERLDEWYQQQQAIPDILVITGFIASTPEGVPTTLKRDGSDFSAAIMGALLLAKSITIWTDVDGVYSADPRKVSEAVVLSTLSYQEAWEMSYFGANVLHPRTTLPAMKYNIPIIIKNVFRPSFPGTWIGPSTSSDQDPAISEESGSVKGFATIDHVAIINVEGTGMAGVPGTAGEIFMTVKEVGANVIMISQASSEHSICFAVPETEAKMVAKALEIKFKKALGAGRISKVEVLRNCSILAAVGQKMASTPGVSATFFTALAKANINIRGIAQGCSEYNITVVVDQEERIRALKAVHARFYLSKTPVSVGVVGPGLIGGTLLEHGIDLTRWKEILQEKGEPADMAKFTEHLRAGYLSPNRVMVDCTASAFVAEHYDDWLQKGIHIVTPNKKANSGPLQQYLKLRNLQRKSYTHYFYEATVGAGLPIISTLRGLLETGDKILKIEGIFSGTLSYIFNNFNREKTFSGIVAEAKASGFTEPDPRDDLSGMDVGRKVVILARESGLQLELEDIPVQSLVPEPLQSVETADEFMQGLPAYDLQIGEQLEEAEARGEVLRYIGVVDCVKNEGSVELKSYPKSHAFAQLSGSDNIIAFTTTRYRDQPLIVRGPGAGKEVTAGGVFCDVLRLAAYLGAPS